jgi:hypothetical protein
MKDYKILPFVCRFKDARAGKSKQNVIEISKKMNDPATIRNSQQQPGSPLLTGGL